MKSSRRGAVGAAAVACTLGGWANTADASGFASQRFGGEQGTVVATNPTALYYNPGAMGFSEGSQLGVYGTIALRHATWTHALAATDTKDPPDAQGANTGEAHLLNVFAGPAVAGTLKIGNLVLGAGFFAPFYGRAHWAKNDAFTNSKYPLAADGVQRWFGIDGEVSVVYFTAGAAYRLGPISIGAAGNLVSSNVVDFRAKSISGAGLPDTSPPNEGRSALDVKGFNGSFSVGAMIEVLPAQLWLGGSYQAQPGLGPQSLDGSLLITRGDKVVLYPVTFHQSLPDVIRAGVRWRPKGSAIELRLFGDMTRWSVLTSECIGIQGMPCGANPDGSDNTPGGTTMSNFNRSWNDTYGGRLGLSYWAKPEVELFFGAGYETAAVPDATMMPDVADAINVAGAFGARVELTRSLFLSASYTHIQYMNRDNTGKSTTESLTNGKPVQAPTVQGDGGGQYTQWIGTFNGNLEAMF